MCGDILLSQTMKKPFERCLVCVCVSMAGAKRMSYFSDIIFIIFHNLLCSKGGIIAIADFPQDN